MNEDKKAPKGNPLRRRSNPLECAMLLVAAAGAQARRAACSAVGSR